MNNIPRTTQTSHHQHFETFFQGWLTRQSQFLQQLLDTEARLMSDDQGNADVQVKQLIGRVMAHYIEYYEAKSRVAHHNVFLVFSPPWFTPYERMFLWMAGFKPTLMFLIVTSSGVELKPDQACRMGALAAEISSEQRRLADQLATAEEELTAPSVLALARMLGREVNGMVDDVETELDRLMTIMRSLVARADYLREKTVLRVVEILDAGQTVRFLAAATQLQLSLRIWGTQREREASTG